MMASRIAKTAAGFGFAATLAVSFVTSASAAPLGAANLGLAASVPAQTEQVRCYGCWVAGGVAAGVIAGAAVAGARNRYYGPPPVVYGPPVVYAPAPRAYAYGKCWVQTGPYQGQGYYGRC